MKKKTYAPAGCPLEELLAGIRSGRFYVFSEEAFKALGFESMAVDLKGAPFYAHPYVVQVVEIPANKRGNLSKYAGQNVEIIFTNISRSGARAEFWIRKHNDEKQVF